MPLPRTISKRCVDPRRGGGARLRPRRPTPRSLPRRRLADSRYRAQLNFRELAERFEQLSQVLPDALRCVQEVKEMQVRGGVLAFWRVRTGLDQREGARALARARAGMLGPRPSPASRTRVQGATSERLEVLEGRMQSEEAYLTSLQELQEAVISQSGTIQDDIKVRLSACPDRKRRRVCARTARCCRQVSRIWPNNSNSSLLLLSGRSDRMQVLSADRAGSRALTLEIARTHAHQERMAQLRQVLDEREKYLLDKVHDVEQEKLSTIERQREQCLTVLESMRSASRQVIQRKLGQIPEVQTASLIAEIPWPASRMLFICCVITSSRASCIFQTKTGALGASGRGSDYLAGPGQTDRGDTHTAKQHQSRVWAVTRFAIWMHPDGTDPIILYGLRHCALTTP